MRRKLNSKPVSQIAQEMAMKDAYIPDNIKHIILKENNKMSITDIIKDNRVYFDSLRQGYAYYRISYRTEDYTFPVPLDDIGTGTLLENDKAILYMRWIRKAMEDRTLIKKSLEAR